MISEVQRTEVPVGRMGCGGPCIPAMLIMALMVLAGRQAGLRATTHAS